MAEEPAGLWIWGEADPPRRMSRVRLAVAAIAVLGAIGVGIWLLCPRPTICRIPVESFGLRNLIDLLRDGPAIPPAPDGRVDVYAALRRLTEGQRGDSMDLRKDLQRICYSERARTGPTWDEIKAGDYSKFPYERRRGAFDPVADPPVPVLWERAGLKGGRHVAFSDGSARFLEEPEVQEMFRRDPGQE